MTGDGEENAGMMQFDDLVLVRLIRVADRPPLDADEGTRIQDAHLAYIHELWRRGVLIAAGPVDDGGDVVGISVMTCPLEEAQTLVAADPGVQAGRFTPELTGWQVPAGMLVGGPGVPPKSVAEVIGSA
jgi:uncharacterized protein YciI